MKKVLIIGGSSDIGISLAKYLNILGYQVIITYNHHELKISNIETIKCDITSEEEISKLFAYLIKEYKYIDIMINMAAISLDNLPEEKTKDEFMKVLEVNLVGTFLSVKEYGKYITDGLVINISSTDGIDTGSIYNIDYAASKAGIIGITKPLSLSFKNRVICVCPNWIDSDTTNEMNKEYLESELIRIKQSRLITKDEFNECINKIINMDKENASIFRIDIKGDKLWMEKI